MKNRIRQRALELGFDDCRFTTAEPPQSAQQLRRWLAEGRNGEMVYLGRNEAKRVEPGRVLPGARSVITLAASYAGEEDSVQCSVFSLQNGGGGKGKNPAPLADESETAHGVGVIARYARYRDYHDVL